MTPAPADAEPEGSDDGLDHGVPAPHPGCLPGAPGCWLWPLAVGIWRLGRQAGSSCPSLK